MSDNIPAKREFDQARAEAAVRELLIAGLTDVLGIASHPRKLARNTTFRIRR